MHVAPQPKYHPSIVTVTIYSTPLLSICTLIFSIDSTFAFFLVPDQTLQASRDGYEVPIIIFPTNTWVTTITSISPQFSFIWFVF